MTTDYEKKYNEALNWMRELYPGLHGATKEDAEHFFPELRESEDERIRRFLITIVNNLCAPNFKDVEKKDVLAYLEKQKEQEGYEAIPVESTLEYKLGFKAGKESEKQKPMYNLEIPAGDVAPAEEDGPFDEDEFLEGELSAFLQNYDKEYDDDAAVSDVAKHFYEIGKKQKEQNKCPEFCSGHCVGCERNEQKDYRKLYEDIAKSEWFKKAYEGKSLGCDNEPKEQKPKRERNKPKESWLEKSKYELAHEEELLIKRQKELSEIRALKDKEQKPAEVKDPFSNANFVRGYESGYADAKREQKPIQTSEEKEYIRTIKSLISDFIRDKQPEDVVYYQRVYDWLDGRHIEQKSNIELIQRSWYMEGYHDREFGKEPKWIIKTGEGGPRHEPNPRYGQPLAKEQKPAEWSEEEKRKLNRIYSIIGWAMDEHAFSSCKKLLGDKEGVELQDFLRSIAKPKQEWSEEDEKMRGSIIRVLQRYVTRTLPTRPNSCTCSDNVFYTYQTEIDWLKSLPMRCLKSSDNGKPSEEQKPESYQHFDPDC